MFDCLIHADWSAGARKRWQATATKVGGKWLVSAPERVRSSSSLMNDAFLRSAKGCRVLIGFDFPIGLPLAYATKTGFMDFPSALSSFGEGKWSRFFDVSNDPADVSVLRPFYPRSSRKGVTLSTITAALGVATSQDLLRQCERKTDHKGAACYLFWTLGPNQVGRAAIGGWREAVRPSLSKGARLWPFDGALEELSRLPGVVIAETYPAEAYYHVGIAFKPKESKTRQADRLMKASIIFRWAERNRVDLPADARATIADGFGPEKTGDEFDAFAGLLGMIEVAEGRRSEGPIDRHGIRQWEGWILGQAS